MKVVYVYRNFQWHARKTLLFLSLAAWVFSAIPARSETWRDSLTERETQWLSEHPKLRLGVGVAFPPFMWVEKGADGRPVFKGMVSDYLHILKDRLGVDFEIVFNITFDKALALGRAGKIDLFPCLSKTPERSQFLLFTEPYLSYPLVVITREDAPVVGGLRDLQGKRLAIVKHLFVFSRMQSAYSNLALQYVFTRTVDENLEAVSTGQADACIINLAAAVYYIQRKGLTNLRIAAPVEWKDTALSMGVRKDWPILKGILQKALSSISQAEKDRISQRWIRVDYEPGVDVGRIWRWSLGIGSGLAILFSLIIAWNRRLRKEIEGREKAEKEREKVIEELQTALDEVKTLQGFIPICANCKDIRNDEGYWQKLEQYIQTHSEAQFSHGICPECAAKLYPDMDIYHGSQQQGTETSQSTRVTLTTI